MNNRDKKALQSLKRHKDKLLTPNDFNSAWVSKLCDLLLKYLGSESMLYKSAKSWYSLASNGNSQHMNSCVGILDNSIEFIQDNGIEKEHSFWRILENTNKSVIVTISIFIINTIFWSGYLVATYQKTKSDFDIMVENKNLKDSLTSIRKSFKITNNKTKADTTAYKQSSNDEKK